MKYDDFVKSKGTRQTWEGIDVKFIPELAKPFQTAIIKWALSKGRAAIFADCGLGKTLMQLTWARNVADHTGKPVLILAPITVSKQTLNEAVKFGISIENIEVINYEKLHQVDTSKFSGVVLDESSILKNFTGKTRQQLCEAFKNTHYRLACTATPSPNDFMELGNHSEFLGVMPYVEMLAMYFIHDGGDTAKWRLKGHGARKFWEWLAQWSVVVRQPSDIGFAGDNFTLPELNHHYHHLQLSENKAIETLFDMPVNNLSDRLKSRRDSISDRVERTVEVLKDMKGQCIIWCELNDEAKALMDNIVGAKEIKGNDSEDYKSKTVSDFADGKFQYLITKPDIAAFGVNWQQCNNMVFTSVTDSFERTYQAIRRCWRFGQTQPVNVHFIYTNVQQPIIDNLKRKEKDMEHMNEQMAMIVSDITKTDIHGGKTENATYAELKHEGQDFTAYLGDCVKGIAKLEKNSVGYSIFSPPFASLYTYSNSDYDMGNCTDNGTFAEQFRYLIKELHRVMMSGRLVSFHCMNLPSSKQNDGFIGIKDFRGDLIRMFQDEGFIFHSEVVIWKDPVTAMQRTKALGLLHKQIKKDSAMSRQGIPDYLVTMRKAGENIAPISNTSETFPVDLWQQYASPVWMDINPSDTLQFREARESDDERHICPLQIQVIERGMKLWSREGDLVLSPFMGIGSEGYVALRMNRRFVGFELKKSYFDLAVRNLTCAKDQLSLSL